jgi:hypothetical protein
MPRRTWAFGLCAAFLLTLPPRDAAQAPAPPGSGDWPCDVVRLKKGPALQGLVLEQTPGLVRMKCVSRRTGAPTVVYTAELAAADVERVDLLPDQQREQLRQRLEALRQERRVLTDHLRSLEPGAPRAGEVLDLRPAAWVTDPHIPALEYRSSHFRLLSNARREVVELAAIHLEQVYAAYARSLPPRVAGSPTLILVAGSADDYRELLRGRGLGLSNPAFFDATRNQVVCVSDLGRLADELQAARRHHGRLRTQLASREAELRAAYRGPIPAVVRAPLDEARKKIEAADARNAETFALARERLFRRLYHEAFHAYLAGFVYPPAEAAVPPWLNEGLAQVFETAIVEVGELRLGHADAERLEAVRRAVGEGTLLPLDELLRCGASEFQVAHGGDRLASDRHYLASWALAFCLTFDRHVLGTPALDTYVRSLHGGAAPGPAFRALVGRPLPDFERAFHDYLRHLRPDGTSVGRR